MPRGAVGVVGDCHREAVTVTRFFRRTNTGDSHLGDSHRVGCESMIECVRRTSRNVKRWQSGEMALR